MWQAPERRVRLSIVVFLCIVRVVLVAMDPIDQQAPDPWISGGKYSHLPSRLIYDRRPQSRTATSGIETSNDDGLEMAEAPPKLVVE